MRLDARGRAKAARSSRDQTLDEYYASVYGARWPALREALRAEPRKVALWNRFCQLPFHEVTRDLARMRAESALQVFMPAATAAVPTARVDLETGIAPPPLDAHHTKGYYLMDYASTVVVEALEVGPFDVVLDLCAAPGGKSVAICQLLSPSGELTANEVKADRCARLQRTLREHVPASYVQWRVTRRDAQTWHDPDRFTRVLVDAPCSSERHLVRQSGATTAVAPRDWSVASSAALSNLQCTLLQRACETCALNGRIVYSTCSLSPLENDGVVERVLRATRCSIEVDTAVYLAVRGTPTRYGRLILPDEDDGWGPMYICALRKVALQRPRSSSSSASELDD